MTAVDYLKLGDRLLYVKELIKPISLIIIYWLN